MSKEERDARDAVNFPAHYTFSKVEVIDAIEAWELGFHRGNAVKYIARAGRKANSDELEDLKKSRWYLDREIKRMENSRVMNVAPTPCAVATCSQWAVEPLRRNVGFGVQTYTLCRAHRSELEMKLYAMDQEVGAKLRAADQHDEVAEFTAKTVDELRNELVKQGGYRSGREIIK